VKRTHKFKGLGDVAAIVAAAASVSAAAAALGVDRSSVHRWVTSGKVPHPAGRPRRARGLRASTGQRASTTGGARQSSPDGWARDVRQAYDLTATESVLVDLAAAALTLAHDSGVAAAIRLNASARFAALVKQLDLEDVHSGQAETKPDARPWPRRVG
jgi:hypothetical protein